MTIEVEETVTTATEQPLPAGWRWVAIGELVGPDGVFTDGDWVESKDQDQNGDVRLIQLADVGDGEYRNRSARFLTAAKASELDCTLLTPGDVLIARMPDPLGRACIFPGDPRPAVTVVDVCVLRTGKSDMSHSWLMYAINSPEVRSQIAGLQSGAIRNRISRGNLSLIRLPIPPADEQRRIAAILREQMAAVERARAAAQAQLDAAKALPAAYLRAVFESDEARAWPRVRVGAICMGAGQYGTSEKAHIEPRGIPVLRMGNIQDGLILWGDLKYIELPESEAAKYLLVPGDILFNRTNSAELVGKSAVYDGSHSAVYASYLIRFRIKADVAEPAFVCAYINSSVGRRYIEANMARAVGQVNISASTMASMPVPVPPLLRQRDLSAVLSDWKQHVASLETAAVGQLDAINHLPAALLRRAFNGEL